MAPTCIRQFLTSTRTWMLISWMLGFCSLVLADNGDNGTQYITYTSDEGTMHLDVNRRPALYTGPFGDCQGNSLINVTRFDAALYRDNLTVMFHMGGSSNLVDERVIMYFEVFAYGENRLNLTFNPCVIGVPTLCHMDPSVPIEANGMIPIGPSDLAGIPSIAFSIPDFEGQAILRLYSNRTKTQIACYAAVMSNGNSFSHPAAIAPVLGLFTLTAMISSIVLMIYGQSAPETRNHYAHSMSIFVVFAVLQHVFFAGSLSMNWPSVLVAFWSNFGWSAGMIYSEKMQSSIDRFVGGNRGNISLVGSAPANENFFDLGGSNPISQFYKRTVHSLSSSHSPSHMALQPLERRTLINRTTGFDWYGDLVAPGLPLPGNYSGFAGTLAELNIPASNALLTGLIWFSIAVAFAAVVVILLKGSVETLAAINVVKSERFDFFRHHWLRFTGAAVLRTCFIAFFMIMYLTIFQFTLGGSGGVLAIAAVLFSVAFVGMMGFAVYALWYRLRRSSFRIDSDRLQIVSTRHGSLAWFGVTRQSSARINEQTLQPVTSLPWWQPHFVDWEETLHVHDDPAYTARFGWLTARFRRSKWWFFAAWLIYEFVRACFYAGAAGHPLTQVFGLLAWETIAFVIIVITRPFESNRLNLLVVYCLGFSKVATVALSLAFDPRFGLSRVITTAVGIIIIVIQGILVVCMMAGVVLGTISSYMSLTRYRNETNHAAWFKLRARYFGHIEQRATDRPPVLPSPVPSELKIPKGPYFSVSSVKRQPKIEDEDADNNLVDEVYETKEYQSYDSKPDLTLVSNNPSIARLNSIRSTASSLPYGARAHRRSWSVKEFSDFNGDHTASRRHSRMSIDSVNQVASQYRAASMKDVSRDETASPREVTRNRAESMRNTSRDATASPPVTDTSVPGRGRARSSSQTRNGSRRNPSTMKRPQVQRIQSQVEWQNSEP